MMLGNIEGGRRRGDRGWDGWITQSTDMSLSKLQKMVKDREAWCVAVHGAAKSGTWLSNWATKMMPEAFSITLAGQQPLTKHHPISSSYCVVSPSCGEVQHHPWESEVKVAQSRPALCDPVDYTVHGGLQARILECGAFPFSMGSSQPRDRTQVSCIAGGFFTSWAIGKPLFSQGSPCCHREWVLQEEREPPSSPLLPRMGALLLEVWPDSTSANKDMWLVCILQYPKASILHGSLLFLPTAILVQTLPHIQTVRNPLTTHQRISHGKGAGKQVDTHPLSWLPLRPDL